MRRSKLIPYKYFIYEIDPYEYPPSQYPTSMIREMNAANKAYNTYCMESIASGTEPMSVVAYLTK